VSARQIYAAAAARLVDQIRTCGAVQAARRELAGEFGAGLRRIDAQRRGTRKKPAAAVRACGTAVTEVFGAGPAVAAAVIGDVRDISRFPGRDRFAACNGTAPAEVSSGNPKVCRPSLRGNRRLNHAIHRAAVTQTRCRHAKGRACYDKKIAGGKTSKEALRALKRQVSDAIYQHLKAGARRRRGPGRAPGERLCRQRGRRTPQAGSSARPLPDLPPPYDPGPVPPRPRRTPGGPGDRCSALPPSPGRSRAARSIARDGAARATAPSVQGSGKGRGPAGSPPIGQACDLPAWPHQGPREGSLVKSRSAGQPPEAMLAAPMPSPCSTNAAASHPRSGQIPAPRLLTPRTKKNRYVLHQLVHGLRLRALRIGRSAAGCQQPARPDINLRR
jgi:Transposase IS116/IS110/IS902 family